MKNNEKYAILVLAFISKIFECSLTESNCLIHLKDHLFRGTLRNSGIETGQSYYDAPSVPSPKNTQVTGKTEFEWKNVMLFMSAWIFSANCLSCSQMGRCQTTCFDHFHYIPLYLNQDISLSTHPNPNRFPTFGNNAYLLDFVINIDQILLQLKNKQSMYDTLIYIYLSNQCLSSLKYVRYIHTQLQVLGTCWCVSGSTTDRLLRYQ